jgi:parallel beta-helix repeat protein
VKKEENFESLRDSVQAALSEAERQWAKENHIADPSIFNPRDLGIERKIVVEQARDRGILGIDIQKAIDKVIQPKPSRAKLYVRKVLSGGFYEYLKLRKLLGAPKDSFTITPLRGQRFADLMGLVNPGGLVWVKEGTYSSATQIQLKTNVAMEGTGIATVIQATADVNLINVVGGYSALKKLQIKGYAGSTTNDAVFLNSAYHTIRDCFVSGGRYCIQSFFSPHADSHHDILNNVVTYGAYGGIYSNGANFLNMIGNRVLGAGGSAGYGLCATNGSYLKVHDNIVADFKAYGIQIFNSTGAPATHASIIGNLAQNIGGNASEDQSGITIDNVLDALVLGNIVKNNAGDGIYLEDAGEVIVQANLAKSNGKHGIEANYGGVLLPSKLIISGNKAISNAVSGITLSRVTDAEIIGNLLISNGASGIVFYVGDTNPCKRIIVIGNEAKDNTGYGISGNGTASYVTIIIIANNIVSANTEDGVNLNPNGGYNNFNISGNIIESNTKNGILIANSSDIIINGNLIFSNSVGSSIYNGINIYRCSYCVINNNRSQNNGNYEIYVNDSQATKNTIVGNICVGTHNGAIYDGGTGDVLDDNITS